MASQTIALTSASNLSQSGGDFSWNFDISEGFANAQIGFFGYGSYTTAQIKASGYGFSVPTGATINGITLRLEIQNLNLNGETAFQLGIYLPTSSTKHLSVPAVSTLGFPTFTLGSSSDLWGAVWTPEGINSPTFGPTIFNTVAQSRRIAEIRRFEITVDYTEEEPEEPEIVPGEPYAGPFPRLWDGTEWVYVKPLIRSGSRFAEPRIEVMQ